MEILLQRLNETVSFLKQHPWIEIIENAQGTPADDGLVASFEIMGSTKLPNDVKKFYKLANGFSCTWKIKTGLDAEIMKQIAVDELRQHDFSKPLGKINILPMEKVTISEFSAPGENDEGGAEEFEFKDEKFTYAGFGKFIRPFDEFDPERVKSMAFIIKGDPVSRVCMLDDYGADWHGSRITSFSDYLEIICAAKFSILSRARVFAEFRGDKMPDVKFDQLKSEDLVPQLFKLPL